VINGNVAVAVAGPDAVLMPGEGSERELVEAAMAATVGELATGVAHEISNPLCAMLGLVELLLDETEPGTQTHRRLVMARESGAEIREILRALSDFAHVRNDELATTTLDQAARGAIDLVHRTSASKAVEIVERFSPEPILVVGNPCQLRQVFVSLIANAGQAMTRGGTITVEVSRAGRWATASVADTGPGIPPEVLPRIFEPFFTTRAGVGGTGLGLAASLAIARGHAGDLSVESSPSGGARFMLMLPALEHRP
jgi:two-component system NtrC family sensor kinase